MAALHLHTSNQLEVLADELAQSLRSPPTSPFDPEVVVVQSRGMARWLQLELARRQGICAHISFPFPKAFSHQLFQAVLPEIPAESQWEPAAMSWTIYKLLPEFVGRPEFEPLRNYLAGDIDGRKRFQLSGRIAFLFDQYLIFRPEMILNWDAGAETTWQATLWRALTPDASRLHPAALQRRFLDAVASELPNGNRLPRRVSVFGISALPPYYVELFAGLAMQVTVNLFLLQPSSEYWGDIVSERERGKLRRLTGLTSADLHIERGNRLLSSLGQLGRDFLKIILDAGDPVTEGRFIDPNPASLLGLLQADMLHLRDRGASDLESSPRPTNIPADGQDAPRFEQAAIHPDDRSIEIHCCHSPLREMEVLHDQMLSWFDHDPSLAPRDILVLMPNLDLYAPLIEAVFDSPEDETRRIPFSLADRSARRENHLIDTFLSILELPQGRVGVTAPLGILQAEPVRKRFGLAESDLDLVQVWVEETRIRWGIDAAHRKSLQLPAFNQNSWRAGLDRLLLGYAMAGKDRELFNGILPYDHIEGTSAGALGKFVGFIETLFATIDALSHPRRLDEWELLLRGIVDRFFETNDRSEPQKQLLHSILRALGRGQNLSGLQETVPLAVILESLESALADDRFGSGFLSGGVTFCALKPMRSIPFKIICLAGMNDGDFPRHPAPLGFDLMAAQPRLGDRSSRDDDRYLFLEMLVSARQKLYISHVGQSLRDNSQAPPSAVVGELLDAIEQGFEIPGAETPLERIVTKHRLQAFSAEYFKDGRLFSYSSENCRASESLRNADPARTPFAPEAISDPDEEFRQVEIASLAQFFRDPAGFFCTQRLGLRLPPDRGTAQEREPISLNALETYQLREHLLALALDADDPSRSALILHGTGCLPAGAPGNARLTQLQAETGRFLTRLAPFLPGQPPDPVQIQLDLAAFRLTGKLGRFGKSGLLHYRCAPIKPKDVLRLWIEHLAWNAQAPQPSESILVGTDASRHYSPLEPETARNLLSRLLELYWKGLKQPLKFFPASSSAFAAQERKWAEGAKVRVTPIDAARKAWEGDSRQDSKGERDEEYVRLCFGRTNPLDAEFAELAHQIFAPILDHETEAPLNPAP